MTQFCDQPLLRIIDLIPSSVDQLPSSVDHFPSSVDHFSSSVDQFPSSVDQFPSYADHFLCFVAQSQIQVHSSVYTYSVHTLLVPTYM